MAMNDDSASRRRRADQREPDWRTPQRQQPGERWEQPSSGNRESGNPYSGDRSRERPPQQQPQQQPVWSNYTGPSYSQQSQSPPRQEPAAPPPQPPRAYDAPQLPQYQVPQYNEPLQRQDPPRYVEPSSPYAPPPPAYDAPPLPHMGYSDPGRDELFTRDQAPLGYDQNPYGSQSGYRPDPYEAAQARAPMMPPSPPRREDTGYYGQTPPPPQAYQPPAAPAYDAQRFAPQESPAARSYFPEDALAAQRPAQQTPPAGYSPQGYAPPPPAGYEHDRFDPRLDMQESWEEHHGYQSGTAAPSTHNALVPQHDDLDEDFFGDEDEYEQEEAPRKGSRMKLVALLLVGSIAVAGGGMVLYKKTIGGGQAMAFIPANSGPAKVAPDDRGGKNFPHSDKSIYDRLTPERGGAAPPPVQTASPPAPVGSSLEQRIDEALKRARTDQPTVVPSEHYRADGSRDDRLVITPQVAPPGSGGLVLNPGTAPAAAPPPVAFPARTAPVTPPAQFASVAPAPAPRAAATRAAAPASTAAPGWYVSLRSSPDEKAVQRDIPGMTDKYRSVLGDVQLSSKIVDLGTKVTYRLVAGPLGTQAEAAELCQKIKGVGGDKACFVTK